MKLVKLSDKNPSGTSFYSDTVTTTVNALRKAIGEPQIDDNGMRDKVNYEWTCETNDGIVFCIYDWKEYRALQSDEQVTFHIGALTKADSRVAREKLVKTLGQ